MNGWLLTGVSGNLLMSLAAGLGGAILVLYILKLRRRRVQVPFSPLWARVLQEQRASSLWEKLKRVFSLFLHLVVLALILLALANPRREGDVQEGRSVVIVVDSSASMMATDEEGARSRIDRAREEAREVLSRFGPRDEVMLVQMDGQLRPLTPFVNDLELVDEMIRGIEASATAADIGNAMAFAVDSLAGRPRGEIVLISDGAFPEQQLLNFDVNVPSTVDIVHVPIGREGGNVGITAFNVRRYPANRTNYEVYVRVENYVDVPVSVDLSIYGEGRLIEVQRMDIPPGAADLRIYPDLPAGGDHLEAHIEIVAGDAVDVFPPDDVAYALMPRRGPLRVLLVSTGNLYLEGPLLLNESIETTVIPPMAYEATNGSDPSAEYDVTIFDRVTPYTAERGNFMYIQPTGEFSPWEMEDNDVADPIIHRIDRSHPLMQWIPGLRDVNIARARNLDVTSDDHVVASAIGGAPMIIARETLVDRRVAVAFSFADTDLPLRVAFPVFLLNALDWFSQDTAALLESHRTGETWFVPINDREVTQLEVDFPSGRTGTAQAYHGTAAFYGSEVGYHELRFGDETYEVAGNLANRDESQIAPPDTLTLGDLEITIDVDETPRELGFDPWVLLALIACALMLIEWYTWNRRITV